MEAIKIVLILFVVVFSSLLKSNMAEKDNSIEYMYKFIQIDAVNFKEFSNEIVTIGKIQSGMVSNFKKINSEKKRKQVALKLQNIYRMLRFFRNDHCPLLIDSWQGVDTEQTLSRQ